MRRLTPALVAAAAAVALTGCGPSAEVRFRDKQLAPVQQRIEHDKAQLSGRLNVARMGHKADARAVAALVAQLDHGVAQMARLSPPASIAPAFRRYVGANRSLVVALRRFAVRLGGHSETRLNEQADAAQKAAGEIARARDALYAQLD